MRTRLKERDGRGVVTALYLLDPTRVQPMVAPNGNVYYAIQQDVLSGMPEPSGRAGARDHPRSDLPAVSPALRAVTRVCVRPCRHAGAEDHSQHDAALRERHAGRWCADDARKRSAKTRRSASKSTGNDNYSGDANIGKIAVLGNDLKFEKSAGHVGGRCAADRPVEVGRREDLLGVPCAPYMVGVGSMPTYNNIEALNQQFYSQCLQLHLESLELCLKEGLDIADPFYIESDLAGLLRMDSATKMKTATDGVRGGIYTPNEARALFDNGSDHGRRYRLSPGAGPFPRIAGQARCRAGSIREGGIKATRAATS
jgi:hypothetical protein